MNMKQKCLHRVNWIELCAFHDPRYKKWADENQKELPGKTNNNVKGTIGRAGLIEQTLADKKDPANADVGNVLHPNAKPGRARSRFVKR